MNMYRIDYDVNLNQDGRPSIVLDDNYEDKPEDKFFAFEMTRYVLQNVYNRRSNDLSVITNDSIQNILIILTQIADEMANILWADMVNSGNIARMMDVIYHVKVKTVKDLHDLPNEKIYYSGKVFDRFEGMKVLVEDNVIVYVLKGGVTNENWVTI